MSAAPMHSVLGQASACRRISEPRAPGPMMPMRIRSLAPRTLDAANVPARLVATLPMKLRRDCMDRILLLLRLTDKTIIAKEGRQRTRSGGVGRVAGRYRCVAEQTQFPFSDSVAAEICP